MAKKPAKEKQTKYITAVSTIAKYGVEKEVFTLRQAGFTYPQIAEEINASGKLPEGVEINQNMVFKFLKNFREGETIKEIVARSSKNVVKCVGRQIDIIDEYNNLYLKAKDILEEVEADANKKGKPLSPYHYKALVSEMRELLKTMIDIQKEISDHDNVKRFMEIIISTVKAEAPEALPVIALKLKEVRETQWFSKFMED